MNLQICLAAATSGMQKLQDTEATPITFKQGCTSNQEIYSNPLLLDTLFLKVWFPY